jgi:salicylate hydroxylase
MTPYLAQGGAMAIEDAAILANSLSDNLDDLETAFARYARARRPRVRRVWRAARGAAELYHMGAVTGSMRNVAMRLLGGGGLGWRYRWIYRWRPPETKTRRPKAARSVAQGDKG